MAYKEIQERYGVKGEAMYDYLCDTLGDLEAIGECVAGSTAYIVSMKKTYIRTCCDEWTEKKEGGGASLQTKSVTITVNGSTTEVIPDEGKTLSKVTVETQVNTENRLPQVVDRTVTEVSVEALGAITKIGAYAFSGCGKLSRADIPDSVTEIGAYAFSGCGKLSRADIPDSVTEIGAYAFSGCSALESAFIHSGVKKIGERAYVNCTRLRSVTISDGVTDIGAYAFMNTWIESIVIPDSVTELKTGVFQACQTLKSVIIGKGVTKIGHVAFSNIGNATITMLPTTPPTLIVNPFLNSDIEKIIVPAGTGEAYKTAEYWSELADIIEEA